MSVRSLFVTAIAVLAAVFVLIVAYNVVHNVGTGAEAVRTGVGASQVNAETSARADTSYGSAQDLYALLAAKKVECTDRERPALSSTGSIITCRLFGELTQLETFTPPNTPASEADGPFKSADGKALVIVVGRNWQVTTLASFDPKANQQLVAVLLDALGGRVLSAG